MSQLEREWQDNGAVARIQRSSALRGQADRAVASGQATRILPGIVAPSSVARDPRVLIKAMHIWHPDAVVVGKAALILQGLQPPGSFLDPIHAIDEVEGFCSTRSITRAGIRVHRWRVPRHYLGDHHGISVAAPEVSILLLAIRGEWEWVTEALRQGIVSPDSCRAARSSLSWRFSKKRIAAAVADIRLKAWSIPELECSRLLRAVGITGAKPNHAVHVAGRTYILDEAFEAEKVAVEIDGRSIHSTVDGYENTMMRSAHLDRDGWKVLHVTPTMLRRSPQFVLDWIASHLHKRHRPRRTFPEYLLRQIMNGITPAPA
nr:DUF559 domain-containing protein [Cutibacterium porci]